MEGLQNLGSTCAINSFIQIFCRINPLRNSILNEEKIPENSLSIELKEILHLMYNEKKSLTPGKFINNFYNIFSNFFIRGEQLDISELLYFLLNKLNEEISIADPKSSTITSMEEEHNLNIARYNDFKTSKLLQNTQGSIINIIECKKCNNKKYNFEPFISIQLDIINNENPCIADMILNYLKSDERKSDDWKCEKCNCKSDYIRTTNFWNIPNVLFLIVNRFNNGFSKNMNSININKDLVFNKGSIFKKDYDAIYDLKAMGLHHGISQQGGHYTAICKNNDKIIHYDDDTVNEISEDNFNNFLQKNNTAYLLVYELKND